MILAAQLYKMFFDTRYSLIFVILIFLLNRVTSSSIKFVPNQELLKKDDLFGIMGGKNITINKAKFVGVLIKDNTDRSIQGTVTILNNKWLLTSALNVKRHSPTDLKVRVGSKNYDKDGILHEISKIFISPQYNGQWDNSIALIKLKTQLKFSSKVGKIGISSNKIRHNGSIGKVYGFGYEASKFPGTLQEVSVPIIHYKSCRQRFQFANSLTHLSFCSAKNKVGPCSKDSGSPVVQYNKLVGIYTMTFGCGASTVPTIYADVTRYKKWIQKTIKKNRDSNDQLLDEDIDDVIEMELY